LRAGFFAVSGFFTVFLIAATGLAAFFRFRLACLLRMTGALRKALRWLRVAFLLRVTLPALACARLVRSDGLWRCVARAVWACLPALLRTAWRAGWLERRAGLRASVRACFRLRLAGALGVAACGLSLLADTGGKTGGLALGCLAGGAAWKSPGRGASSPSACTGMAESASPSARMDAMVRVNCM